MHWTSYLAYRRRYHPDTQIISDLGCVGCGYNLRGLRVVGNCPECGAAISDSLYVLAKPAVVAEALRSFANSYATFLIFVIGCLGGFVGWQLIVTLLVIALGALYRLWWAAVLHFRGELTNSQQLSSRARGMWWASITEMCAIGIWIVASIGLLNMPTGTAAAAQWILYFCGLWFAAALVNAAVSGWFGLALAVQLGYAWMVVEFRIQIGCAIGALLAVPLLPLASGVANNQIATMIAAGVLGLISIVAIVMTWITLHHASNAAERANDTEEDVLAAF